MKSNELPSTSKKVVEAIAKKFKEDKEKTNGGFNLSDLAEKLVKRKLENMKEDENN